MSTELSLYERITDPMAAVKQFGQSIALSKIFNCENVAQGEVFAMECLARREPPLSLAERYHVIFGKLSMKADAMLSGLHEQGGKHKQISRTAELATIELTFGGETQVYSLSWADAQQEPFVYEGKDSDVIKALEAGQKPVVKTKYRTPRARMQMLWARVVSDGVRAMCPQVNCGRYTPEEIDDIQTGVAVTESANGHPSRASGSNDTKPATPPPAATDDVPAGDVIDAEFTVDDEPVKAAVEPKHGECTAEQSNRIKQLWGELGATPEHREKMLASRGVQVTRQLTSDQAEELIYRLAERAALALVKKVQAGDPTIPCAQGQADSIRAKLREVEQLLPGTIKKVKAKMALAKLERFDQLTVGQADELLNALGGNQMEAFFGQELWAAPVHTGDGTEKK